VNVSDQVENWSKQLKGWRIRDEVKRSGSEESINLLYMCIVFSIGRGSIPSLSKENTGTRTQRNGRARRGRRTTVEAVA